MLPVCIMVFSFAFFYAFIHFFRFYWLFCSFTPIYSLNQVLVTLPHVFRATSENSLRKYWRKKRTNTFFTQGVQNDNDDGDDDHIIIIIVPFLVCSIPIHCEVIHIFFFCYCCSRMTLLAVFDHFAFLFSSDSIDLFPFKTPNEKNTKWTWR